MKRLAVLLSSALVLAAVAGSHHASADPTLAPVSGAQPAQGVQGIAFNFPWVKGTIKVTPAQAVGNLAKINCGDFSVVAESEEQVPRPANIPPGDLWVSHPVWSHTSKAQGNFASGACTYAVTGVAGKKFHVTLQGNMNPAAITNCQWLQLGQVTPGQRSGLIQLAAGATKVQDWTVGQVACGILH
jgi:hypothetical protein